ncbi:YhcN/YlaJ family sporulation lipoprotein [Clostridium niameyense]|uniref:YhcN/YlaJ family sporulation lipoprotein n=1 Tax=Clostridium niameyense TaxID=1622073 RepID=A0A6M0RAA2_9CLOT|nr:YhcN/YlaJ family sporulation lipoprotein [Clostridium niameyense]NEZ47195.1 YhcN/YlaJ family sporulation lipoprotein [Clostridium niameyense]
MKLKNRNILSLCLSLFLLVFVGTGCANKTSENPPANNNTNTAGQKANDNTNTADQKATENKTTPEVTNGDLSNRAKKIADELVKIDGIEKASVVISEKRALVGVTLPSSAEGKITNELKKKVEDKVKSTDKEIDNVAVSADADIYQRISKVSEGIIGGKGIKEFGDEIGELFRRITPQ